MAFAVRRPFAIAAALKQLPKSTSARTFQHASPFRQCRITFASKTASPITTLAKSRNGYTTSPISALAKSRNAFSRSYMQNQSPYSTGTEYGWHRIVYIGAILGGTIVAINLVFNRETREDGGMPPFERSYLNETFLHTGLGVGIIGVAARALHQSGWSIRMMAANPWLVMGGGLVLSIGSMYACFSTAPEK